IPMPDRTAASMEAAIRKVETSLPKNAFQTATVDRGKEFACYGPIEKSGAISFYFADPYSSWQRGSNENGNGLLREFYP
ncbi:IS30 family transposase, partial [Bacillus sp. 7520-S]